MHNSPTAEFSKFGQLYSLVAFVNVILSFGFETAFFRFSSEKGLAHKVFSTSFWFLLATSSLFLALVLSNVGSIANYLDYNDTPEYISWFAIVAFFDAICVIPFAWLRFHNKPIRFSLIRLATVMVHTALVFTMLYMFTPEQMTNYGLKEVVAYPFFANVVASAFAFLLLFPVLFNLQFKFDFKLLKRMLPYAFPIMLAGLAFITNEHYDKLVQRQVISKSDAGAYAGIYKIAALMSIIVTAYRLGVEPFFFKQMNSDDAKVIYSRVMTYFVAFASIIALGLIANVELLMKIFRIKNDYLIALDIVPIIVIAYLFFGVYYNLSTWYKVVDKTWVGSVISWIGAGLTIILTTIYLPKIGFMASAWITLIIYSLMMIISYFWGQKKYPIPYQTGKNLLYLGLSIGFSLIAYIVADKNIIIGNILLMLFVTFVVYKEKDTALLKNALTIKRKTKNEN